jgi:hypothetical protein
VLLLDALLAAAEHGAAAQFAQRLQLLAGIAVAHRQPLLTRCGGSIGRRRAPAKRRSITRFGEGTEG